MKVVRVLFCAGSVLMLSMAAEAACDGYSMTGEAEAKFNGDRITAISATGVSEVVGSGALAITTAMKKASLKARGALARYLSQDVTATQLLEQANVTESSEQNGQRSVLVQNSEKMVDVIRSHANDIIKGATNVAECYDDERKIAFVKVGVSDSLARALGQFDASIDQGVVAQPTTSEPSADGSFERKSPNAGLFE